MRSSFTFAAASVVAFLGVAAPSAFGAASAYSGASSDGSRVFFTTTDKLVPGDTDGARADVYQRAAGKTTLISTKNAASDNGAASAAFAGATPDGKHVFFTTPERLVPGDTDTSVDLYERTGSKTTVVSPGNGHFDAKFAGVSANGLHVFFTTAERLSAADSDSSIDVYDRAGSATNLISRGQIHGNGAFDAAFAGSSADGTKVFFETNEQLAGTDTDGRRDVYERAGSSTTQVSRGQINGNGQIKASFKGTSTDGSVVFFQTEEKLASSDTDANVDIYRRSGGATTQISRGQINGNGAFDAAFRGATPSGSAVFFVTSEPLANTDADGTADDVYERTGSTTTQISQGPKHNDSHLDASFDAVSSDGSRVLFSTGAGLVDTDKDKNVDVFVRTGGTTANPTTAIVSQNPDTGSNGPFDVRFTGASTDARLAFFESDEGLTPEAFDGGRTDVFAGTPNSLSQVSSGGSGPFDAHYSGASGNGSRVFFTTAERLAPADTDTSVDVYEHSAGATKLVSAK